MPKLIVEHIKQIGGSDVMPLVHRLTVEEIDNGFIDGRLEGTSGENEAYVLRCDNVEKQILAFICFSYKAFGQYVWISGSWTHSDSRSKGYNTRLFKKLCVDAKKRGARSIDSLVHVTNDAMIQACYKQGRVINQYYMIKEL